MSIPARSADAGQRSPTRPSRRGWSGASATPEPRMRLARVYRGLRISSRVSSLTALTAASRFRAASAVAGMGTSPGISSATLPYAALVASTSGIPSVLARWTSSIAGWLSMACHSLPRHLCVFSAPLQRSQSRTLRDGSPHRWCRPLQLHQLQEPSAVTRRRRRRQAQEEGPNHRHPQCRMPLRGSNAPRRQALAVLPR